MTNEPEPINAEDEVPATDNAEIADTDLDGVSGGDNIDNSFAFPEFRRTK